MTDIFTQEIKDLIKLATTDFDEFYKKTEQKSKSSGNYSKAASSGYHSTAASSGDYSTAASSGYHSKAASSGNYSKAASSGDHSKAASSGNYSKAASSGYYSGAASSGYHSTAASSGDHSKAASSGDHSKAASSGVNSACSALGYLSCVKGDIGNLLMCSEFDNEGKPLGGKADIVDGEKIKQGTWYSVLNGKWIEVDLTDGLFNYVLSVKGNVKKLKKPNGGLLYLVCDVHGNSAHGKTIKQAREALLFKTMDRDVSAYKNMPLDTVKSPTEWAAVYSVITGACQAGCQYFIEQKGKLKKSYTLEEILKETEGAYGYARFKEVVS